jgi:methylated-DNA-[protein]-cysteine S-methyltransferase
MTATHTIVDSPLGPLTLTAVDGVLSGLYYLGHRPAPRPDAFGARDPGAFADAERQLAEYFAGERTAFELAVHPAGGAFQQAVWGHLDAIPYGATCTYGDIARALGGPALARAVGTAVGRNPLSVIRPCHRVLGRDGRLTGYAGGLDRKQALLELEGVLAPMA